MLAPERRTRTDIAVAVAIVVALAIAAVTIWLHSDARGTTSITASTPASPLPSAASVPTSLTRAWTATSGATESPIAVNGVVATADDGTVTGRDPRTGKQLWSYQRNMPLCGAISAWATVVAVYRDRRGCSQVTELAASDGSRQASRNSDADNTVQLSTDGTYVLASGPTRLEMWRSDLVRTVEYGRVDAPVNPKSQPRTGCKHTSAASSPSRLWVLEQCPNEPVERLTVLNPAPKDATKPEEYTSTMLVNLSPGVPGARILVASEDRVAIYLPGDGHSGTQSIGVFDSTDNEVAQYPVPPMSADATAATVGTAQTLWTGNAVIAWDPTQLASVWTFNGALGPGALMAGRLLVPVAAGIAVLEPATGQQIGLIPLHRDKASGPITTAVAGSIVIEQQGNQVTAWRPAS
ncbi:PQQ-binding-like beta-propeller repeat protein [Skermania sp. ID1734]|uniref:Rv3212 family protein n=1 Tax=Skermania sp. ID1734 TaxID=2597516 RepID=UPI00118039D4|nr:PQQ-binding-like beta-propeller repeat protein [Skermania sp. ID1734]TSD97318.1 PQQ-binding-like beta-propeller repeat protein [Skermania sp. ID1734]